jgi:hypothetical protein
MKRGPTKEKKKNMTILINMKKELSLDIRLQKRKP